VASASLTLDFEGELLLLTAEDAATVVLYRAVGLKEADDIRSFGGFRPGPAPAFVEGKWFAVSFADAVRWGWAMPPSDRRRSFVIASVTVPATLLTEFDGLADLDGIGPAYFVRHDLLPKLNAAGAIVLSAVFDPRSSADAPPG
jgi:hypothetical protein